MRIDMTGARHAAVVGVCQVGICSSGDTKWQFRCDCGDRFDASGYAVRIGRIISCPKCSAKRSALASTKHGKTNSIEFSTWVDIQSRCYNKNRPEYESYGGRGITVCSKWLASFSAFMDDMGARPSPKHSIDRIDNDGNYEPANCRWATRVEQANNKRNNVLLEINGQIKTIAHWAKEAGVTYASVYARHLNGVTGAALLESSAQKLMHGGITDSVSGWSKRTGIKQSTISMRINKYKWTVDRALTEGASL